MFNKISLLIFLLSLSCSSSKLNISEDRFNLNREFISVFQGPTSEDQTVINFLVPDQFEFKVVLYQDDKLINGKIFNTKIHEIKQSYWKVIELQLHNLSLKHEYKLEITQTKGGYSFSDTRYFRTYDIKKKKHRFIVSSCMSDALSDIGDRSWPNLEKLQPDAYFLIGDLVYADLFNNRYLALPIQSEQYLWSRYVDTRNALALYRMKNLKPIYSMWDDHDTGQNNANKDFKFIYAAQKTFRAFFPLGDAQNIEYGRGLGFSFAIPGNTFFFLDNRSFRDNEKKKNGEHIGREQTKWLFEHIKKTDTKIWLIEGDQFFGGYHSFESFEGNHPEKFKEFITNLKELNKEYRFISGDRHLYEFMKIDESILGKTSFEVTSSGTHAKLFPGKGTTIINQKRLSLIDDQYHSLLLELDGEEAHFDVINDLGKVLDSQDL